MKNINYEGGAIRASAKKKASSQITNIGRSFFRFGQKQA